MSKTNQHCVIECDGCMRRKSGSCIAFSDPKQMWQGTPCWGYETDKYKVALALYECVKYALRKRFDAFLYTEAETMLDEYLKEYDISQVDVVRMKSTLLREMQSSVTTGNGNNPKDNGATE